jgi:hypothetical protein
MIRYFSLIVFIFLFSSCWNKPTKLTEPVVVDTLPAILIAGLGDMARDNIQNRISKKYGFKFLRVGGCVVSKKLSDSMRFHNEMLYKKLEEIHGKGLRDKLFRKIDFLVSLQYQVEYVLNHDPEIIRKNFAFGKKSYEMFYEIDLHAKKHILNIHAYDWSEISGEFEKRIYYTLSIDTSVDQRFRRTEL